MSAFAIPLLLSSGCYLNSQSHNLTAHCGALPVSREHDLLCSLDKNGSLFSKACDHVVFPL